MELVTFQYNEGQLTIGIHGRLDTLTSPEAEKKITEICDTYPDADLILDFEDLEYVSSTGLRVVLHLRKKKSNLHIINVSSEIYEILEMTGFSEMIPVQKAFRHLSVEGCEVIGKGAKGAVYRYDEDTIIKVYFNADSIESIRREQELGKKAFVHGIPTAIPYDVVKVGEQYGAVFELLNAKSYSQLIREDPEHIETYVNNCAELLRQIHNCNVKKDELPDGSIYPKQWADGVAHSLSSEDVAKLNRLVENIPVRYTMIHGDFHTNNIMLQGNETLLIDMDTLCYGHPVMELANIHCAYVGFTCLGKKMVENFLEMPAEMAQRIWDLFLPAYLQTNDPKIVEAVGNQAALLSYTRIVRHIERRNLKTDEALIALDICKKQIHSLLAEVNTLDF